MGSVAKYSFSIYYIIVAPPLARDEELVAIIPYNDKRLKRPKR